jgi:hypothetical protein
MMTSEITVEEYSCLKGSEGGIPQKEAMDYIQKLGLQVKKSYSPYVGHYGLTVTATKEQHEEVSKFLFD